MGTRGSVGIIKNNRCYITYNHFDSYPSGLGVDIIDFINENEDWTNIDKKITTLKIVDENEECPDEFKDKYKKFWQKVDTGKSWYAYLRSLQGVEWLKYLNEIEHMSFMKGSLKTIIQESWIEYSYIINLDDMTFNFWCNSNDKPDLKIPLNLVKNITYKDLQSENFEPLMSKLKVEQRKVKFENLNN